MFAWQAVDMLTKAAPFKDSWVKEPHGAYFVNPRATVRRVLYCVTATEGVAAEFKQGGYDLLVSHHPYIVGEDSLGQQPIPQVVLHTALDCCVGGMNDQWRDAIGIKNAKHFDRNLGWYGEIEPTPFEELRKRCESFIGTKTIGMSYCDFNRPVESVVVCSGLGGLVEGRAFNTGADCYILGEAVHDPLTSPFDAMIECGHTLSEYGPGLRFVCNVFGYSDVVVSGSIISPFYDHYQGEIYGG